MHYTLHWVSEINASFKTLWSSVFSCPFDRLTIYDGPDNLADKIGKVYTWHPFPYFFLFIPLLGTYCGQMRNLVVFSTHNQLYVTFHTLKRTAQVFNRGFFGIYEFSEDYVKLGEREMNNSGFRRIVEEEFYFQILSRTRMRSTFGEPSVTRKSWARRNLADTCSVPIIHFPTRYIPRYFPQNVWHFVCCQRYIVCRYFIYGMQDSQNLERVVLSFDKFDIPGGKQISK